MVRKEGIELGPVEGPHFDGGPAGIGERHFRAEALEHRIG
jgi:hypothetical protein